MNNHLENYKKKYLSLKNLSFAILCIDIIACLTNTERILHKMVFSTYVHHSCSNHLYTLGLGIWIWPAIEYLLYK